ncbi:uncharacterized protein N7473_011424 [Penicillium subrubescens]|uniref:uncharacterized protein n=1 Tax=Penicillium subrubescens TaxID=1316194 RepID=UPI0025457069|nr:uncharacterized protein N7473_011424 [Penicillium subrubescens]KAJ5880371.1 hypothetical protein N7473_011424 [Penicillium subrubescens]
MYVQYVHDRQDRKPRAHADAVDNDLLSNPVPSTSDLRSLNTSKGTLTAACGETGIFRGAGVVGV